MGSPGTPPGKVRPQRMSWRRTRVGVSAFPMNEAHIDLNAQDSSREGPLDPSDDRLLLTTRLPPITPPPMRPASVPPSSPPPSFAPSGMYRTGSAGEQPRSSWWNALLTATFPPPSIAAPAATDERVMRRRIGATCAGMALGFVILALALGLRGAEPAYSPAVAAALVIARAIVALGFLAFGYALLRMAERFFTGGSQGPDGSRDAPGRPRELG
jgi:hypothetical protein